jgi:hypothetical protein
MKKLLLIPFFNYLPSEHMHRISGQVLLNLGEFQNGIYIAKITDNLGNISLLKIIKN